MTETAYEAKAQEAEAAINLPVIQQTRAVALASAFEALETTKHVDEFDASDLMLPRLKIVQTSGGYMKANNPAYIKEAKEGDLIDTVSLRLRAVQTVILVKYEMHYTTWRPKGGALVKQWFKDSSAFDAATLYEGRDYGFRVDGDGNWIAPTPTYYILMVDTVTGMAEPATMSWGSTQAKKVKRVNTLARAPLISNKTGLPFNPPLYARLFDLTTVGEQGKGEQAGKSWFGWYASVGDVYTQSDKYAKFALAWDAMAKAFRDQVDKNLVKVAPEDNEHGDSDDGHRVARPMGNAEAIGPEIDKDAIPF